MVTQLVERLTRLACSRCGGKLRPEEVDRYHVTLACLVCGNRRYVGTAQDDWM